MVDEVGDGIDSSSSGGGLVSLLSLIALSLLFLPKLDSQTSIVLENITINNQNLMPTEGDWLIYSR